VILIFFIILTIWYFQLRHTLIQNTQKETTILFYSLQNKTNTFLSSLMYAYTQQKPLLLQKHKLIYEKLLSIQDPLHYDLTKLQELIDTNNTYNIYLTDEHFIIKNTTFKNDLGFNLSFAKEIFYKHKAQHTIGISTPIYEKSTKEFFSYTDSFFPLGNDKEGVLQLSYTYHKFTSKIRDLKKEIESFENILDAKAYIITNDGFVTSILLHEHPSYKPSLEELLEDLQTTKAIKEKLHSSTLDTMYIETIDPTTQRLYIATQSPIFPQMKIFFTLLIDQTQLHTQLFYLTVLFFILSILGFFTITILYKLILKEKTTRFQDFFLRSWMHELKTPLSIISLNNELRELKFGKDIYSKEIDAALRFLKATYEDLHFALTASQFNQKKENLCLSDVVQERIEYFTPIATSHEKEIHFIKEGECHIHISKQELERIIDNNLTNAIKYAYPKTTISVVLLNGTLSFETSSPKITNTKKVFERYFRENTTKGGHGLGLWIIQEIAKQNNIQITLTTKENKNIFTYHFQCLKGATDEHSTT